ncbi:hypothetical protein [Thomasclavelia ramosa]|mgnify:FL=1|uniref:Cohesin domain-containing protein n=1 Tax=Thomasclavelia ramosa TaxID=1547 RepID=A0A3E3E4C5_9FIRM|nr:hypothetical protein [Thomasclavelia ramosa]RGD76430.1 hypothetical protein DXB93_18800 [Thomasclavelia ramosa]
MKREIISVITTFVLILSSHFSMIYALDKPHLNLNEKEDSLEITLNLPKVENGLDAFSGKIDYDQNKLELVKVKQVSKKLKTPEYNENNGKFILLINSKTINESVDAVCFIFKVKENIKGDTTVKVTELTGATSKNQKINLDDVQTVFTTDKKENNSNTGNGSNSSNTSKDNDSKNDTNKSNTTNDSHKNSDEKNTSEQNKVSSDKSLSKENTKKEIVSANKTNQKSSVNEETKKDTDTNKTTSSEDKTSSKEGETSVLQDDSKQKNSNEKLFTVKKEPISSNILIIGFLVVALLILLLLPNLRKKNR